jgi:predicted transcriptional regulator
MPKEPTYVTITISGVPVELRDALDELAQLEHRDRSGQIVKMLEQEMKARRAGQRTLAKAA